jgi:hypothetical protein
LLRTSCPRTRADPQHPHPPQRTHRARLGEHGGAGDLHLRGRPGGPAGEPRIAPLGADRLQPGREPVAVCGQGRIRGRRARPCPAGRGCRPRWQCRYRRSPPQACSPRGRAPRGVTPNSRCQRRWFSGPACRSRNQPTDSAEEAGKKLVWVCKLGNAGQLVKQAPPSQVHLGRLQAYPTFDTSLVPNGLGCVPFSRPGHAWS